MDIGKNGSHFVTWRQAMLMIISAVGVIGGAASFAWTIHTSDVHPGALEHREFERYVRQVDVRQEAHNKNVNARFDRLENKMDQMLTR